MFSPAFYYVFYSVCTVYGMYFLAKQIRAAILYLVFSAEKGEESYRVLRENRKLKNLVVFWSNVEPV